MVLVDAFTDLSSKEARRLAWSGPYLQLSVFRSLWKRVVAVIRRPTDLCSSKVPQSMLTKFEGTKPGDLPVQEPTFSKALHKRQDRNGTWDRHPHDALYALTRILE